MSESPVWSGGTGSSCTKGRWPTGQAVSTHAAAAASPVAVLQLLTSSALRGPKALMRRTEAQAENRMVWGKGRSYRAGGKEWKERAGLDLCAVWSAPVGKHQDERVNKSFVPCGLQLLTELIWLCPWWLAVRAQGCTKPWFNAAISVSSDSHGSSSCSRGATAEGEAKELITRDLNESELHLHFI